jgi:N-acetylneuraminate synthase
MNDSQDFSLFAAAGEQREQSLQRCRQVLAGWGLTMPPVAPLTLDFGLGRFEEIGETEWWVANEEQAGYCGKFLFVHDGQTCPYHKHARKHETFFVLKGSVRMIVDDQPTILKEGDLLVMPPGKSHSFTGIGPALLLEVSMPSTRQDNFFADKNIGDHGVM